MFYEVLFYLFIYACVCVFILGCDELCVFYSRLQLKCLIDVVMMYFFEVFDFFVVGVLDSIQVQLIGCICMRFGKCEG